MMENKNNNSINEELRNLWEKRQTLKQSEWNKLCLIVFNTLKNFKCSEIYNLEDFISQEDLVNEFIVEKVLRTDLVSDCYHTGALRVFYKNFLKDKLRKKDTYNKYFDNYNQSVNENDSDDEEVITDQVPYDYIDNYKYELNLYNLKDLNLTFDEVENSAKQWLEKQESWVKLFLGRSYCQDSDNSEALSKLAKKEHIKSYAYKAEQLGFNWKSPDYTEYKNTMIGQWISTLNVEFCLENMEVIGEILKILCLTSLSLVDEENI